MYSCVPNNSLAYNKCHSHGLFKDPGRLLDALLNKFIKSVPNKQCFVLNGLTLLFGIQEYISGDIKLDNISQINYFYPLSLNYR